MWLQANNRKTTLPYLCVCVCERELQQRFKFLLKLKKHTLLNVNAALWQVEISETEAQAAQREQDHSADVVFMVVEYSTVRLDDRGGGVYVAVRMGGRLWRRARPCLGFPLAGFFWLQQDAPSAETRRGL